MLEILAVEPGSIAEELELEAGDCLLTVNGRPVRDLLDYQLYEADEELLLEVRKKDGQLWDLELDKDAPEPLGLHFEHPEPTQCGNNCLFCFVHQLPRGMRPSLYVKDEDYRFSYLYGAYVTLSNVGEAQIERIIEQRLSPLYVSVHATEEQLRERLLGRRGPPVLELLRRLTAAGIELHTQIVLCPGLNDGPVLERTVTDLQELWPGVRTLAVVPVGLTGYRQRLPELRPPTAEESRNILEMLGAFQQQFLAATGTRFVFAADELYLKAGRDLPPLCDYEDLAQIENGVGLLAQFRDEAREVLAEAAPLGPLEVSTLTGASAHGEVGRFVAALAEATGTTIHLHPVENEFFGGQVSVTGLLTGADLVRGLKDRALGSVLLVPEVLLKEGEDLLLDDLTLVDLEREFGVPVRPMAASPWGLLSALEDLAVDPGKPELL